MKIFLLYEYLSGTVNGKDAVLIDVYTNWDKAEQARIGMEIYKEHAWLSYDVVEWDCAE